MAVRDILTATDEAEEEDGEEVVCVCACDGLRLRRKGKGKTALAGRLADDVHPGHSHADVNGDDDDDDDEDDDDDDDITGDGDKGAAAVPGVAYTSCFSSASWARTANRSMRSLMRRCRGPLGQDTTNRSVVEGMVGGGDETGPDETTRTI